MPKFVGGRPHRPCRAVCHKRRGPPFLQVTSPGLLSDKAPGPNRRSPKKPVRSCSMLQPANADAGTGPEIGHGRGATLTGAKAFGTGHLPVFKTPHRSPPMLAGQHGRYPSDRHSINPAKAVNQPVTVRISARACPTCSCSPRNDVNRLGKLARGLQGVQLNNALDVRFAGKESFAATGCLGICMT